MLHPKYPEKPREGYGTVVAIVGAGVELTEDEVKEIYGKGIEHAKYSNGKPMPISVFTRPKRVDLIVVKRDDPKFDNDGHYVQPNALQHFSLRFPLEIVND